MNGRLASFAPGLSPDGDASVLCVHFAADGREHSLWYLDPEDTGVPATSGFTAGLSSKWHTSPGGVARAVVSRGGGKVLCEALLLVRADEDASVAGSLGGTLGSLLGLDGRRGESGLLLRTAPRDTRCPACGGAGYVRGEPCLACS